METGATVLERSVSQCTVAAENYSRSGWLWQAAAADSIVVVVVRFMLPCVRDA